MEAKFKDIRNAIDNGSYLSALALALTLPDICGKVMFQGKKGRSVYIDWFNEFVYPYYQSNNKYADKYEGTEFDGIACYCLRCAYLHSGNTDLGESNLHIKINQFDLCISSNKDSGVYVDMRGIITSNFSSEKIYRVRLDVRRLCKTLCDVAEKYYKDHVDKELFIEHKIRIINMEEEMYKRDPNYKPVTDEEIEIALKNFNKY
ncbi:hypothetical protein NNC19_22535 [Clostridium sp. SHJSY1]|uniref:hypothetical protein n=1 Tax=Clostridium sp. SHJSY1 TaxID=2942483 RepID=UPI0028750BB3|nr:hypothetical protein [Clostridium sp. SHJSY1]MDS0528471.1 hypothetical protein [Clostridium sp. SHJSY1]